MSRYRTQLFISVGLGLLLAIASSCGGPSSLSQQPSAGTPAVTLSPAKVSFGNIVLTGDPSSQVTVKNTGTAPLSITSIVTKGNGFSQTNTCQASLAAGAGCSITVAFTPAGAGPQTGTITIMDNASNSPQTVALSGTGILPVTLSPSSLSFAAIAVGTKSSQTITVTNNQNTPLRFTGFSASGDFTQASACPAQLAGGGQCAISVTFAPTTTGNRTGSLTINDNVNGSPQTASLQGTGNAAQLVSIAIQPSNASLAKGTKQQFSAIGTYTDGSNKDVTATASWSSSSTAVATVSTGMVTAVSTGNTAINASYNSVAASTNVTVGPAGLVSIALTPSATGIALGTSQQFKATGTFTDGSTNDLTSTVAWKSSAPGVATVNATGTITSVAAGAAIITASSGSVSAAASLNVTPAVLVSITVTPISQSIPKGTTQQFTATGTYSDNTKQVITNSVTWTSSDAAVAVISNTAGTQGIANGASAGSVTITAKDSSTSITGNTNFTVSPAALKSIALTPANASIAAGTTQQFAATGTFTDGSTQDVTGIVTWSSSNTTLAIISNAPVSQGLATAKAVGIPAITATSGSISASTNLNVTAATLVSIAVTPVNPSMPKGTTQQFVATGTYTDQTTQVLTTAVMWTSSDLTIATISDAAGTQGLATSPASGKTGTVKVTAALGNISGSTSLTVSPAALVSIAVTPGAPSVALGFKQQFTATGTFTDKSTQDLTSSPLTTWSSSAATVATIGASTGLASSAAVGTTTITATNSSVVGSTSFTVTPATLTAITVSPATPSVASGALQQFKATGTYTDGTQPDITSTVTWKSSQALVATISNDAATAGLATALAGGPTTISASLNSVSGETTLTVTGPPALLSIAVTPAAPNLGEGSNQQFTASGSYTDNSSKDLSSSVTWNSSNTSVATINSLGLATAIGSGSSTISATSGLVSGSAVLTSILGGPITCSVRPVDMKVLVVAKDGTEVEFPAVKQILDYVGIPYTVFDSAAAAMTADMLSSGCHGFYQGVIFTDGGLIYTMNGAAALEAYEKTFGVRQVNWYVFPGPDFGLNASTSAVDTTNTPIEATFTSAAQPIFSYANTANPLKIQYSYTYLATAVSDGVTTPLLHDSSGNTLAVIHTTSFAGDWLSLTFDSNQYLTHDLVLAYGLVNWVTKGLFLGDYHVYAAAQVDDFFINDAEWIPGTPCTDPITHDRTAADAAILPNFRIKSADMTSLVAWQNKVQSDPLLSNFKLTLAFNGVGTTGNRSWTGLPAAGAANDDLVVNLHNYEQYFHWISHTYDHPGTLNGLHKSDPGGDPGTPKVDDIDLEVLTNLYVANGGGANLDTDPSDTVTPIHLTDFSATSMVTPGVTGLNDSLVPTYLFQDGIRYVVTDTSVIGQANNGPNPSPNVGIVNSYQPGIYEVPRHPNDIFFNAANWNDDQAEFSCIYNNPVQPPFNTYNAAQILDFVSTSFVNDMLLGDMDPEMFHQPNLHDYDGQGHSLLSDTYDQTFSKYEALYKLPVLSLTLDQMGEQMQARNAYNQSGVTATVVPGVSITITALQPAVIPVTGLNSAGAESYGGQYISYITLSAGQSITLPLK